MTEVPQAEPAIVAPAAPAVLDAPYPLDDVRAVLTTCGLAENAVCFITCHIITGQLGYQNIHQIQSRVLGHLNECALHQNFPRFKENPNL